MNELLQPGHIVQSSSGKPCRVVKFLGSGGQGEVHMVEWAGGNYALKWYYEQCATAEQRAGLESLITEGPPDKRFLWPLDLVESKNISGFGYVMGLRGLEYKSLYDLVAGRAQPSFTALVTAGLELTSAFRSLHTRGLCYRDISFGNAFFNPLTGAVLVCDNDNVTTNRASKGGVLGTPDFMAPEVVRMEASPSNRTDLFSLAVLLFYMLHIGHPLIGRKILSIRCWDGSAREMLFGKQPVFIFDPNDHSNEAVGEDVDPTGEAGGNALIYWKIYPQFLRDTFTRAFTNGIHDPENGRVTELEWLGSLSSLRDSIFKCACGAENFYQHNGRVPPSPEMPDDCWSCGKALRPPFRLRIDKEMIMLNAGAPLYPHHTGDGGDYDFSAPVAAVVQNPKNPAAWGLKNLGATKWVAILPGGRAADANPGQSVPLANGVRISFGKADGEILY